MTQEEKTEVGLCAGCKHAATQPGAHQVFWRCRRADLDPDYRRYPPLPVIRCEGFEPVPDPPGAGSM